MYAIHKGLETLNNIIKVLSLLLTLLWACHDCSALDWRKVCECLDSDEKFLSRTQQGEVNLFSLRGRYSDDLGLNVSTKDDVALVSNIFSCCNFERSLEWWDSEKQEWVTAESASFWRSDNSSDMELSCKKEGFYKISVPTSDKNAIYLIVVDDISKSLLKYLVEMKKDVEENPDPELYKSSIFVSKINHLLGNKEDVLTCKIARKLCQVAQEYQGLKEGKCPELTPGLYKICLKRFPGAHVMEYVLRVPESYDPDTKALFVYHPDVRRSNRSNNYTGTSEYITLYAHSVTFEDYYWDDFKYIFDVINDKLNIDPAKNHIVGSCGNGIPAMGTALEHPDFWGRCTASLGNSKRELAGNACNMQVRFSHHRAHKGMPSEDGWFSFMVKCFEYNRCPNGDFSIDMPDDESWINGNIVRNDSPVYIQYRTDSLKRGKAYWVSVDGRNNESLYADIKAKVIGSKIFINTKNVESYSIFLEELPVKSRQISIIETDTVLESIIDENRDINVFRQYDCDLISSTVKSTNPEGIVVDISIQKVFKRYPKRYTKSSFLKSPELAGGINNIFTQRFAVVCPYLEDEKHAYTQFAQELASGAPCYPDFESARKHFETHNIIFIGSSGDFLALPEKVRGDLPFKMTEKTVTVAERLYSEDMGVFFIHPNPLSKERYLAIFICNSNKIASEMPRAFSRLTDIPEFDFGIFRVTKKGQLEWPVMEKLDATWNYHGDYSDVLANVEKTQEWRWKAWRAEVIRKQIGADLGIFENCFTQFGEVPEGKITKRDIHRIFQNTWIVKIRIKGNELKRIITVPFADKGKRHMVPEISGVTFTKTRKPGQISIVDIKDEETYTLACPQKCLNGARIGLCPDDYQIIDDKFAVEIILDYLSELKRDLDKELAEQTISII